MSCRHKLSPTIFVMETALKSLLLLVLATIDGQVWPDTSPFVRCPLSCHCFGNYTHTTVECEHSYLTDIPKLPIGSWVVTIKRNNITRIRAGSFSEVHNVKRLEIQKNSIHAIDKRAFDGLTSLNSLTLHEELLSSFENGVFRFFTNLTSLNMGMKLIEVPQREICLLKHLVYLKLVFFQFPSSKFNRCFEELGELRSLSLVSLKQCNISRLTFLPFRASLRQLMVSQCGLRRLSVNMFKDLSRLQTLDLTKNSITDLPKDIFAPLTHLTNLNIGRNKLKLITGELLRPLWHLKLLTIGPNDHANVTLGEEFLKMTQLRQIVLSGTKLTSLDNDTFLHLRHCPILEIDIAHCSLRTISNGAFRPLRNLTKLSLDLNPLNDSVLHGAFYGLNGTPLRELYLNGVQLQHFSAALFEGLNDSIISIVSLKNSQITSIKCGVFRSLRKVTKLDMSYNKIVAIEDHAFDELTMLSSLNLAHNNIFKVPSFNVVGISSSLRQLFLDRNLIQSLNHESLIGYENLTKLLLTGNKIRTISSDAFISVSGLLVLDLGDNDIHVIQQGTFDTLLDLNRIVLRRNFIQQYDSSMFQRLQRLEILDISENTYFGRHPSRFRTIFQNLPSLLNLNIYACGIEELAIELFINTTNLRDVILSDNSISSWNSEVFAPLRHLQLLTLARNQIVSVNVTSFSKLISLRQLDISLNPFACNCDLMWFFEYVQNNNIFVINIGSASQYTCASPESLHGVPVLRAGLSPEDCVSHADLILTLSASAAIVLSAIVFALVHRGRWYIRYYVFLIRSRRRRYYDMAEGSYAYDAFVAHNSNDASWIVNHLLPQLETEGRYRLCLHQRDWPVGREISENIVESIERSRKVIVVLSNNFAQSQWCRMELEMANHCRLSSWRNSLVLVLLEPISEENQNATLRYLLTTQSYLEWKEAADEKFWNALRKAIRRPPEAPLIEIGPV